jgi:hypothetical protein
VKQATLATALTDLLAHSTTTRCRIERLQSGEVPDPTYEDAGGSGESALVDVLIAEGRADRQGGSTPTYSHPVTHDGYCEDHEHLVVGCRLVEAYRQDDVGDWIAITAPEAQKFVLLGKFRVLGMPKPWGQLHLHLWQATPARGRNV